MEWLLVGVAVAFFGLCFVHLGADFPNGSAWNDWSKMTDEGWYGGAAVRQALGGAWYLPGSFNPVVAMPVWPVMLRGWFGVTGVGMVSARVLALVLYGLSLGMLYGLLRRERGRLSAAAAVALVAVNPFCYAFGRMGILEPVLVFWMMLGLWLAQRMREGESARQVGLGVVLCLLLLTKSTGLFLVPAVLYQMWASMNWPRRGWMKPMATVGGTAALLWMGYYAAWARPHIEDYRLLFAINKDRVHLSIMPIEAWKTLRDGLWINPVIFWAAVAVLVLSAVWLRELWRAPLFGSSVLATVGYLTFIWYHTYLQPRYYLVMVMPVVVLVVIGIEVLWARRLIWGAWVLGGAVGMAGLAMMVRTLWYAARPEYSFQTAAEGIAGTMRRDGGKQLLLGSSADDVTMWTGVAGINSEYAMGGIDAMLDRYRPEWFAAWNGEEDYGTRWFGERYWMVERGRYRVFDDPERNVLVLYRLEEKPGYRDRPGEVLRFMK
ncbi:glycosyltransferase family 39 protein [Granulicella sibirica]|uniref:Glycosyltransferase RgtA/B/C/D-like domain-containing protein n=1 Tax=Granulicella sibirica TaxID=2479048 RepID=A0A4Q0T3G4_9BACT|nr:glycosyltransferase family 39 protein [Granulicella sibirica]RXH57452.1 hypothetical protein GRAN_0762 [Granulicella sibirica]